MRAARRQAASVQSGSERSGNAGGRPSRPPPVRRALVAAQRKDTVTNETELLRALGLRHEADAQLDLERAAPAAAARDSGTFSVALFLRLARACGTRVATDAPLPLMRPAREGLHGQVRGVADDLVADDPHAARLTPIFVFCLTTRRSDR